MADTQVGGGNPGGDNNVQPGAGGNNTNTNTNTSTADVNQPGNGNGGNNQPKQFTYTEDRTDWVPRHRLNEESTRRQKLERDFKALNDRLTEQDTRLKTAFGINTPSAEEQEREKLKKEIAGLIDPAELLGLSKEEIEELKEAARISKQQVARGWQKHATEMLDQAFEGIAAAYSVKELSVTQKRKIHAAYLDECREAQRQRWIAQQRGERDTLETLNTDEDFLARHEAGDPKLIDDFVRQFLSDWHEPARRVAEASVLRRNRPVPSGDRTKTPVTSTPSKVDLKDDKNDEKFKAALLNARRG